LAAESRFARTLLLNSECYSVLAPVGRINFDDAAIFWASFYHVMFKANFGSMSRKEIIQAVERGAGLTGETFRLFWKESGKVRSQTIQPAM
jgi:hypothetical protein